MIYKYVSIYALKRHFRMLQQQSDTTQLSYERSRIDYTRCGQAAAKIC